MRDWRSIDGWFSEQEGNTLATLAIAAENVLELGAYKGRSTVCMARVGAIITTVDTFLGDVHTRELRGQENTKQEFFRNIQEYRTRIIPLAGDINDIKEYLPRNHYGMVFIDGAHDYKSVVRDTVLALECVVNGGVIAWHDFTDGWPEVKTAAVDVLNQQKHLRFEIRVVDSLAWVRIP